METDFVICLFDTKYSKEFLASWVSLCRFLKRNGFKYKLSQGESCNAFYAKQTCLGGDVLAGKLQKPFRGILKYRYIVFIAGDIKFTNKNFYDMYTNCNENSLDFLSAYSEGMNLHSPEFKMVFIRQNVVEQLEYPWFIPHVSENEYEMNLVDKGFCDKLKNIGVELNVDQSVVV